MSITTLISKLLDLPPNKALQEAQNKLEKTTLLINGQLLHITEIRDDFLYYYNKDGDVVMIPSSKVVSIEEWLPRTGVYFKKGSRIPVYLEKKAVRQWRRSFCDSLYTRKFFSDSFSLEKVDVNSHTDFFVDENRTVFYHTSPVGYIKDASSIVCTNPFIAQEMKDWFKDTL